MPVIQTEKKLERFRFIAFVLGLTCLVEVNLAGRLMGADLVCLVGAVWALVFWRRRQLPTAVKFAIGLAVLWLCSAIASDFVNHSATEDIGRGQSRIIILISGLYFLSKISAKDISWASSFWAGVIVGTFIKGISGGYGYADNPWKFGMGMAAVAIAILLLEVFSENGRFRRITGPVVLSALAVISLTQDFRSMFAILMACAALLFCRKPVYRIALQGKLRYLGLISLLIPAYIALQGITAAYGYLAESGTLGYEAQNRYVTQASLGLSELQAGRTETLVSFQAIGDSPLLGHGSWAHNPIYSARMASIITSRGGRLSRDRATSDLIPSHSHIIGAWVDHGILALPFWIFIIIVLAQGIGSSLRPVIVHRELVLFVSLLGLWDIFFSPFGAQQRVLLAAAFTIVVCSRRFSDELRLSIPQDLRDQRQRLWRMDQDGE
jgi:hypothetical protein